jgi:protein involved in polysaccharide export with SLBB domain
LLIRASNTFPLEPDGDPTLNEFKIIRDLYRVQSDGTIDLGPEYGSVVVEGLTLDQARVAIDEHLRKKVGLEMPKVAVSMPNVAGKQEISGEHLVRPDGSISLGVYGSVHVAGMTLAEVKTTVEATLSQFIHRPEVQVDVLAYNSKSYYVITDGGGNGEQVVRLPFTGNETVLDAIANVNGLSEVSSKNMWLSRPAPAGMECAQRMPIDYRGITQDGVTSTNYQIFPGDRVYIEAERLVAADTLVGRVVTPFNRIFGFILLGNGTVRTLQKGNTIGSGGSGSGFF